MYLEILLQLLLYHIRSFYSNLGVSSLTRQEITLNRQVQLSCVQLLTLLLKELLPLVKDTGKGFGSYILDLLTRCRVQKVLKTVASFVPFLFFSFLFFFFVLCMNSYPFSVTLEL